MPYFPLDDQVLRGIIKLQLGRIAERVKANYDAEFSYDDALIDAIAERCKESESGARNIENILSRTMLPELAARFLGRMAEGEELRRVNVSMDADSNFSYAID